MVYLGMPRHRCETARCDSPALRRSGLAARSEGARAGAEAAGDRLSSRRRTPTGIRRRIRARLARTRLRCRSGRRHRVQAWQYGSKVDVILANASSAAVAAKRATTSIPIVMAAVYYPVELGIVRSLGHPGGNIT